MNNKRLLTAILAFLLAVMTSCTPAENDSNKTDESSKTTIDFTDDENYDPNILTHVFAETELTFTDGIIPYNSSNVNINNGKLSVFCTKNETIDEYYARKYYLSTFDTETDSREDRLLEIDDSGFLTGDVLVTDEALYITCSIYDEVSKTDDRALVKYNLADDTMTTVSGLDTMLPPSEEDYKGIMGIAQDKDGCIYIANEHSICVLNPDLTKIFDCTTTDYIRYLSTAPTGEVYVSCFGAAYPVDKTTQTFGSSIPIPDRYDAEYFYFGEGYDCYFTTTDGLYGYNFDSGKPEMIMNWQNSNFNYSTFSKINVFSPEEVFIQYNDRSAYTFTYHYSMWNKADDVDISQKTQVSMVYFNDYFSTLPQKMVEYNKSSHTITVSGEDYSAYSSKGDRGASKKLLTEMITGVYTPDIICVEYGFYQEHMEIVSKVLENDLYTDLYEFIGTDPDIKKDDIMGAVKNTFEVDGKLSAVMPSFDVKTMIAPKSAVGDMTSWNYKEVLEFIDSLPEGKKLSTDTYDSLNFYNAFDTFIDYENKTCDFNNPVCMELMEKYAVLSEYKDQAYEVMDVNKPVYTTEPGEAVCYDREYNYVDSYYMDEALLRTKDYVRIGFPTDKGSGSTISGGYAFIIPKNAAHPKEAWDFIRSVILDNPEYMDFMGSEGIRMLRSQNESYEDAMKDCFKFYPYDTNKYKSTGGKINGNRDDLLDENGLYNGDAGTLVLYNEEDYHTFLDFIDSAGSPVTEQIPSELHKIISEELGVYRAGERTAEKTAEILQSRVSIYLSERE